MLKRLLCFILVGMLALSTTACKSEAEKAREKLEKSTKEYEEGLQKEKEIQNRIDEINSILENYEE